VRRPAGRIIPTELPRPHPVRIQQRGELPGVEGLCVLAALGPGAFVVGGQLGDDLLGAQPVGVLPLHELHVSLHRVGVQDLVDQHDHANHLTDRRTLGRIDDTRMRNTC
jgi:hypothetical protein